MGPTITVGIAQLKTGKTPNVLTTAALGSCVGLVLYDPASKTGAMAHAMLPSASFAAKGLRANPAKFVDSAVVEMLKELAAQGVRQKNLVAKIAGGANMFPDLNRGQVLHIGRRNTDQAVMTLKELGIPLVAADIGKTYGRTITLDTVTGLLTVKSHWHDEKTI
ncbi:MAG: chemotaxis protein CheD [Deltaproteobacteria bacterium]|nr:chemotaxis protein CheD [Deltaproteobacteria bacterium]